MSKQYDPVETAISKLQDITDPLEAPETIEADAIDLFERFYDKTDGINGRNTEQIVTACFILAARSSSDLYTAEGVAPFTSDSIDTTDIHTSTRYILSELNIDDKSIFFQNPHKHVDRISQALDVTAADTEQAHDFISILQTEGATSGKKASTVAASVVYLVGCLSTRQDGAGRYVQKEIAEVANVTTVSIRNAYPTFGQVLHNHPEADVSFNHMWWF